MLTNCNVRFSKFSWARFRAIVIIRSDPKIGVNLPKKNRSKDIVDRANMLLKRDYRFIMADRELLVSSGLSIFTESPAESLSKLGWAGTIALDQIGIVAIHQPDQIRYLGPRDRV
jgi:hypothetical protein